MKRVLTLFLSLSMMLMLVACGGNQNNENSSSSSDNSSLEDIIDNENGDNDILDNEESGSEINGEADNNEADKNEAEDDKQEETEQPAQSTTGNKNDASANKNNTTTSNKNDTSANKNNTTSGNKNDTSANKNNTTTGNKNDTSANKNNTTSGNKNDISANKNYSGTLTDLVNGIYAKKPLELSLETNSIDPSSESLAYFTGLSDGSKVKEIVVSEPMMSSQAYSLVVVRVKDAADTSSVAQAMFDGIDQVKWLCVMADSVAVGAYGDTIMLAMADSYDLGETLHTDLRAAYASVVGADKLDVTLERVDPDAVPKRYGAVS